MPSARRKSRQSQSPSPLILSLSSRSRRHNARIKNIKHKTERHHRDRKTTARHINVQHYTHVATDTNKSSNIVVKNKAAAAAAAGQRKVQNHTEQMNINGDHEVVDLCSPVVVNSDVASAIVTTNNRQPQLSFTTATTTTTSTIRKQTSYKSRTLTLNSGRHSILPAFPASIENDRPDLLLANVPDYLLTKEELERRYSFQFRPSFLVMGDPPANIPSFFWPFYQQLFLDLVEHLHLDMSIIDYNYARLSKCLDIWAKERMIRFNYKRHEVVLDLKEYAIALEFFLQIDVDLFYMKTCSFRDVQPQEPNQFLFCTQDPEARHEMIDCGNCGLCYPKYDKKKRGGGGGQPSVKFGLASRQHQFISKYKTILNCPCSCQTCNIIYVLTCPCDKFDYVGESGATLADRMIAHRYHGNRIMHEAFLGQENMKLAHPNYVKSNEILSKDDMHLYRHSIECQSAIQMFLDENPRYWRFVPMTNEEADQAEENIVIATMDFKSTDIKDDEKIKLFIKNLPPPPPDYRFSMRQYYLQYAYFKSRRHESIPNEHLDLYNAKVIAVLPETGSKVLRQIVEALFITHAQTKLNSSGRLVHDDNNNNNNNNNHDHHENVVWCEGLVRRPLSSFVSVAAATTATTIENTAVQSN